MASLQSLDVVNRSATTLPPPSVRKTKEVAKLIDVSTCIGCKACQVACMQWNDLRDDVGANAGTYDNPRDLTPNSWTVMRYSEVEQTQNSLEWLIRKDGCMHCEDPGCLKACPSPGAIVKYSNGIVDFSRRTAWVAATVLPVVRSTFRAFRKPTTRPTSARCVPIASAWVSSLRA